MIKLILEIKEEERITFKNKKTIAEGFNVGIKEIGINATKGEEKASKLLLNKLNIEEKLQIYDESKKENEHLKQLIKNLLSI